jgi:hypothetical protein
MREPPPTPLRIEWDFSAFEQNNPHAKCCYEWEYYREVYQIFPAFRQAVQDWRKNRDPEDDDSDLPMLQLPEESVGRFWFVRNKDWPTLPFQDPTVRRPDLSRWPSEEALKEGHGLQVDLHSLPDLSWEFWPAGSVLVSEEDLVVALHINFRTRSKKDILEQFEKWLRWAEGNMDRLEKPKPQGNASPIRQAQTFLKALCAYRLLKGGRRWKDACNIFGSEELFTDQSGWIDARNRAEREIKELGSKWSAPPEKKLGFDLG